MASAPPLSQQTVIVTGAAHGLGRAIATAFAQAGARLILVDYDEKGLAALASEIPTATTYRTDLSKADATKELIQIIRAEHGPIHTLIHNAGVLKLESFASMNEQRWDLTFNVGIQAAYLLTKGLWDDWQKDGGCGIYVSSRAGIEGFADEVAYASSKHAIEGFVKSLAMEGEPSGIHLHSITPGMYMHTPMSEQNYTAELKTKWVEPIQLTPAFLHLATRSDASLSGKRLSAWDLTQQVAKQ
jgi:NAD(P)-dependent dehydrogenase (short-subunit alcohol dehydrogenase family)